MAAKDKMTDAEKLACYERVAEIIEDRLALERHIKDEGDPYNEIRFVRADAYRDIVRAVFGPEADFFCEIPESRRSRPQRPARKSSQSEGSGSSPKPAVRARASKGTGGLTSSREPGRKA
jgi:hypothetical protein